MATKIVTEPLTLSIDEDNALAISGFSGTDADGGVLSNPFNAICEEEMSGTVAVRQLVFIDGLVADRQRLMCGLAAGAQAHVLDATRDALGQIADALEACGPV